MEFIIFCVIIIAIIAAIGSALSDSTSCGVCKRDISKRAVTCPGCGDPKT